MEQKTKEVRFDKYCWKCKHLHESEADGPCFECLETPARVDSQKPINYVDKID